LLDRPQGGEHAILVHIHFPADKLQEDLAELKELAISAGAEIVATITGNKISPDAKYFVGLGKAEEIQSSVKVHNADLVIFNHNLSPSQERNLEKLVECRVIGRTGLILDIFAQRAQSSEGKLQVELAYLKHMSTRLVRGWTHLERQRGGIGLRGGPGETQLELDRRIIRSRIQNITKRLSSVRKQRVQNRRSRKKASLLTVALVGYTNAGKSTLFNTLTGADVYIANRLFATLDPTLRKIVIPEVGSIILADTVGFIRHLPHDLIEAFHATLEEVSSADLLLHIVDASDPNKEENIQQVYSVLETIDAKEIPELLVFNKIDLCAGKKPGLISTMDSGIRQIQVSALTGQGIPELIEGLTDILGKDVVERSLILKSDEAKLRAELFRLGTIITETIDNEGSFHITVRLPKTDWLKMHKKLHKDG